MSEQTPFDEYRITFTGDGAGEEIVRGWQAVVERVAKDMHFNPGPDEVLEAAQTLRDGIDSDEGWDGNSVLLNFEDGSILVERVK